MALPSSGRGIRAPHTGELTDNMKATVVGGCERISHDSTREILRYGCPVSGQDVPRYVPASQPGRLSISLTARHLPGDPQTILR
jgi:hypothetical protein